MVRKLQKKFILIVALVLFLVLGGLVGTVNGINYWQTEQKTDVLLNMLLDNDGTFQENSPGNQGKQEHSPENRAPGADQLQLSENRKSIWNNFQFSAETPFETRYFSASTTDGGKAWTTDVSHIASATEREAEVYAAKAAEKGKTEGKTGIFRYRMRQTEEKLLIVFVDCSRDTQNIESIAGISCSVAAGCWKNRNSSLRMQAMN